jgi:ribose transport system permease protein
MNATTWNTQVPDGRAPARPQRVAGWLKGHERVATVIALLLLLLAVGAFVSDRFSGLTNLQNVYEQSVGLALVSLGQSAVILSGGIDLSVGSQISLLSVLTSGLIDGNAARVGPVVCAILCLGTLIGAANGLLTVWLRVHPLIVTLGTGAALQGLTLLYSSDAAGSVPATFEYFAYGRILGLPAGATATLIVFLLVAFFLRGTRPGRYLYAVGGDPNAATLLGLPTRRVLVSVYAFSGLCAATTALYVVSRFGVGQPYTGANYTLASITPVVIGGTMLAGGKGGVMGTLLGVYLMSLLNNLLNFMDISSHYQLVIQGVIVVIAVATFTGRRSHRA